MNTRHLQFKAESVSDLGEFVGKLSVYGNVDSYADICDPGCWSRDLKERGTRRPLLWQHDAANPIGYIDLQDSPTALIAKGKLLLDVPQAKTALALLKAGAISGLSVGYRTLKESFTKGVRHIVEAELFEGSVVTFPANDLATVDTVKNDRNAVVALRALTASLQEKNGELALRSLLTSVREAKRQLSR